MVSAKPGSSSARVCRMMAQGASSAALVLSRLSRNTRCSAARGGGGARGVRRWWARAVPHTHRQTAQRVEAAGGWQVCSAQPKPRVSLGFNVERDPGLRPTCGAGPPRRRPLHLGVANLSLAAGRHRALLHAQQPHRKALDAQRAQREAGQQRPAQQQRQVACRADGAPWAGAGWTPAAAAWSHEPSPAAGGAPGVSSCDRGGAASPEL